MSRRLTTKDLALLKDNLGADLPPPAPRKRRSQEESEMQRALIGWWHMQHRVFGVPEILLFSIPNGGGRASIVAATILKAEGLRKGAPDLVLAVQRGGCGALFLELKRKDGHVTPEQETFHIRLREQGYRVEVVRSLFDAINVVTEYLT